jgi:plastocyanin
MQRFRLLGFYLVGLVAVFGLAIWGVSLRRTAAGAPPPSGAGASQGSPTTATTDAAGARVSIDNFAFDPKELVLTAGATVTWVNTDDVAHTVTSKAAPPLFDSKPLHTDAKFSFEFKTPGTYDYFCKPHPYMTGRVIVK